MEIRGIQKEAIGVIWDIIEPMLQMSIDRGTPVVEETTQDILREIKAGDLSLWIAYEGDSLKAVVTAYIADLPQLRRAVIKHLAGIEMESWLGFYPLIEDWARSYGASQVVIKGRAGWARVLQEYGFTPQYVALAKNISHNGE